MKPAFFPSDKVFWLYHGCALFLLAALQGLVIFFWQSEKLFNAVAATIWLPAFTLSVLIFRYFYKARSWHRLSTVRIIPTVLGYGFLMGALVSLSVIMIMASIFWSHFVNSPDVLANKTSVPKMLLQLFAGNTLQTQLFIGAWAFIYISIASNRRVGEAELGNLRLQNSLKEAQLANLNNQLNPHFLFNAINNIRFTIYENAEKADAMLTGLSEMLRYSLERSRQDKVRLGEELEIITLYIDLIKVQMEERLRFACDIPQNLHHCLIPPMILQLLVENAIKHGIDKLRHGGSITLTAEAVEQQLIFNVSNNRGDNAPLVSSEAPSNDIGIGLVNIQERLRLLYNGRASLHIEQTSHSFVVTLILPREHEL